MSKISSTTSMTVGLVKRDSLGTYSDNYEYTVYAYGATPEEARASMIKKLGNLLWAVNEALEDLE